MALAPHGLGVQGIAGGSWITKKVHRKKKGSGGVKKDERMKTKSQNRWTVLVKVNLTLYSIATGKWITSVLGIASAHWTVRHNSTFGVRSTRSAARIDTFFVHTCQIHRTLGVNHTFRAAARRSPDVIRNARTDGTVALHPANRIWTTWGWLTRIDGFLQDGLF